MQTKKQKRQKPDEEERRFLNLRHLSSVIPEIFYRESTEGEKASLSSLLHFLFFF